jgi:hypothetical protein
MIKYVPYRIVMSRLSTEMSDYINLSMQAFFHDADRYQSGVAFHDVDVIAYQ